MKSCNRFLSLLLALCLLLGCAPLQVLAADAPDEGGEPKVTAPTLPKVSVTVTCDLEAHGEKTYEAAVTGTPVEGTEGTWTVEAQLDVNGLLNQYNNATGFRHRTAPDAVTTVSLTYTDGAWSPLTASLPVTCATDNSHHVNIIWWDDGAAAARKPVTLQLMAGEKTLGEAKVFKNGETSAELPYGQLPMTTSIDVTAPEGYLLKANVTEGDTTTVTLVKQETVTVKADWKKDRKAELQGTVAGKSFTLNEENQFSQDISLPGYSAPEEKIDYTKQISWTPVPEAHFGAVSRNGNTYVIPAIKDAVRDPLTITGVTVADKPYDGTTDAKVTEVRYEGTVAQGHEVKILVDAAFESKDAGEGVNVILSNQRLTGKDAFMYKLGASAEPVTATGNIKKANPKVAAPTAASPVYEAGKQQNLLTAEAKAADLTFRYAVTAAGEAAPAEEKFATGIPQAENAGDYLVWYLTAGDDNYNATKPASLAVTVQKAENGIKTDPALAAGLTFTNEPQALVTKAGAANQGDMAYAVGTSGTEAPEQFSKELPTATLAGTHHVWVKALATDNYQESAPKHVGSVTIGPKALDAVTAEVVKNPTYTGEAVLPEVTVKAGETVLVPNRDYTLVSSNNVNVGKKTVTVQQKAGGCYTFAAPEALEFTVEPKPVTPVIEIAEAVYDFGNEVKPAVTVKDGDTVLKVDRDYTLVFADNKKPGVNTASVTVKPVKDSNYAVKETTKKFTIKSAPLTPDVELVEDPKAPWIYNGKPHTPVVLVKDGEGKQLKAEEYSVSYQNAIHAGANTAKVTVKDVPGGEYEIEATTVTFTIRPCDLTITPVAGQSKEFGRPDPERYRYNASKGYVAGDRFTGNLERMTGEALGEYAFSIGTLNNPDYNLTLAADSPKFTVVRNALTDPTVILSQTQYLEKTGEKREPVVTVKDVFGGGETTVDPSEYKVTYKNNEKKGTATVTITDAQPKAGNFEITETTVSFKILASAEEMVIPAGNPKATVDNVKTSDLPALQQQLKDINQTLAANSLSPEDKKTLEEGRDRIQPLVDRAAAAQKAVDDAIAVLGDVTPAAVEKDPSKLADAQKAKPGLEALLKADCKYKNNFTQADRDRIRKAIDTIDACTLTNVIMTSSLKKGDPANRADNLPKRNLFKALVTALEQTVKNEEITAQGRAMVSAGAKSKYEDLKYDLAYRVTGGKDQIFRTYSPRDIVITANGALAKFDYLTVDGKVLEKGKDYTVKSGSTIATFSQKYLKSLKSGKHIVAFHYTDETPADDASTTLTIKKSSTNPKTGDQFNMKLWVGLLAGSAVAVAVVVAVLLVKNKKNKNNKKK